MPRLKRPESLAGAARALNDALHDLHARAGFPSLADLVQWMGKGAASRSRIHEAFVSARLPSWGLVELLVEQLASKVPGGPDPDDEVRRFHQLWLVAAGQPLSEGGERPIPTATDALLLLVEWVNAPLLPFPATRRLRELVDAAPAEVGANKFLINRRDAADGSLLIFHAEDHSHAATLTALVTAFDALLAADRRDNHYRRRPYPQLRLLAHAGPVEFDGQDCTGHVLSTLHEHNESMTVRDALVGDDDIAVIVIASDEVFDHHPADYRNAAGDRWIPLISVLGDAAPLRLWIRTPAGSNPRSVDTSGQPEWAIPQAPSWRLERPTKNRFVLRNIGTAAATGVTVNPENLGAAVRNLPTNATVVPGASVEFMVIGAFGAPVPNEIFVSCDSSPGQAAVPVPPW